MPTKNNFLKFSPLSEEKIKEIVDKIPEKVISLIAEKVIAEKVHHNALLKTYKEATDKKTFFEENLQQVADFLNKCRLIGIEDEKAQVRMNSFVIGAEGLAIISTYLQNKEKYANSSKNLVQVIKNEDLKTDDGSRKITKITFEKKHVHSALYNQLLSDLRNVDELEKTYVVETFGTTGGNHIVALTIKKESGNNRPFIHLFDPSPALARNGLEAQQNSIAAGWCAQITINATLTKALSELALQFDVEKYYNNSEPLQMGGPSLCGTFTLEAAHHISREGLDFSPYQYLSPFGGKTEIPVLDLLDENGYLKDNPTLKLSAKIAYISHFTDKGLRPREKQLQETSHRKKDGTDETMFERVSRYQSETGENLIAKQKSLRQKYGHLFEIIVSDDFAQRSDSLPKLSYVGFEGNPYSAGDKDIENSNQETKQLIEAFNKILPRANRVSDLDFDGENAVMTIYIGNVTASKITNNENQNSFGYKIQSIARVDSELVDFSKDLTGVSPNFACATKLTITVFKDKISDFIQVLSETKKDEQGNEIKDENQNPVLSNILYKARSDYPFTPPSETTPLTTTQIKNNNQEVQP
ncbi:MAG: hypothetical protein SFV53_06130 [Rickettsiales bacterium]|nr:hypothetical protein [Rickettsiales bacterium]